MSKKEKVVKRLRMSREFSVELVVEGLLRKEVRG